jgi:thioredoxin-like negative regulator of GroEL
MNQSWTKSSFLVATILFVTCIMSPPAQAADGASSLVASSDEIANWQARLELARVLSYDKQYDESVLQYKKVLTERPENKEARKEMASVLIWKGDREGAVAVLRDIPESSLDSELKLLLADMAISRKEYDRAKKMLQEVLVQRPDDLSVRLKLANVLSWQKNYDESLTEFKTILKKRPDDMQLRRRYAFVLMWAGKRSEAAAELKKTLPK